MTSMCMTKPVILLPVQSQEHTHTNLVAVPLGAEACVRQPVPEPLNTRVLRHTHELLEYTLLPALASCSSNAFLWLCFHKSAIFNLLAESSCQLWPFNTETTWYCTVA